MDSALRRHFLRSIDFDFAKLELREMGVKLVSPEPKGPEHWPRFRDLWLVEDRTPRVRVEGESAADREFAMAANQQRTRGRG